MDQSQKFGDAYAIDVQDILWVEQKLSIVMKVEDYVEKNLQEIIGR